MKLIRDQYLAEDDEGRVVAKSKRYATRSEALLKEISDEYTRVVQKYPDYKFTILLETDSESEEGVITLTWAKLK